jgi:hypothetical protein
LAPSSDGEEWTEAILHSFTGVLGGPDGANPNAGILFGSGGTIYGTTFGGGAYPNYGIAYELSPPATPGAAWVETVIHEFAGGADGANPYADLISDGQGNFYGTTLNGGSYLCNGHGCGTVFELQPPTTSGGSWKESVIYSFVGGSDGVNPQAALTRGANGYLFGTTAKGGGAGCVPDGCGTVFELKPPAEPDGTWTESVIHTFTGGEDGAYPYSPLVLGDHGRLVGANFGSTATPNGVMFELSPPPTAGETWTYTALYTFAGGSDGIAPWGPTLFRPHLSLAGVTSAGGTSSHGTIYELRVSSQRSGEWPRRDGPPVEKAVYSFLGGSEGGQPVQGLTVGENGEIYGITYTGGNMTAPECIQFGGCGTVFRLKF